MLSCVLIYAIPNKFNLVYVRLIFNRSFSHTRHETFLDLRHSGLPPVCRVNNRLQSNLLHRWLYRKVIINASVVKCRNSCWSLDLIRVQKHALILRSHCLLCLYFLRYSTVNMHMPPLNNPQIFRLFHVFWTQPDTISIWGMWTQRSCSPVAWLQVVTLYIRITVHLYRLHKVLPLFRMFAKFVPVSDFLLFLQHFQVLLLYGVTRNVFYNQTRCSTDWSAHFCIVAINFNDKILQSVDFCSQVLDDLSVVFDFVI